MPTLALVTLGEESNPKDAAAILFEPGGSETVPASLATGGAL